MCVCVCVCVCVCCVCVLVVCVCVCWLCGVCVCGVVWCGVVLCACVRARVCNYVGARVSFLKLYAYIFVELDKAKGPLFLLLVSL